MDNHTSPPQGTLALKTFVKLLRCSNSVSQSVHKSLPIGLTVSQFGILEALYHLGPMSQKNLAAKILKSAGNITTVINNLERDQLVERVPNIQDRRYFTITLTELGLDLIETIFPRQAEVIEHKMSSLTETEQLQLSYLLVKLSTNLPSEKSDEND